MNDKFFVYRAQFNLEEPVIDIYEARAYLTEDNMTHYLIDAIKFDYKDNAFDTDDIVKIEWILKTHQKGYIELTTKRKLNEKEKSFISEWISGQNSDGLGEGFEQQDFACYDSTAESARQGYQFMYEDEEEDELWVMASFDWKTNDYELMLISE